MPPEKADPPAERTVTLDVRWFNATGRKLYLTLGFREIERTYPGYYDFHGGVKMRCALAELASDRKRDRVPLPEPWHAGKAPAPPALARFKTMFVLTPSETRIIFI